MGVFALALVLGGAMTEFTIPLWATIVCGVAIGLGTASGGWRIIRTMGFKLTKLESVHGFAAQASSGTAILAASWLGIPLSTSHAISASILGVGSTRRFSAVRWGVASDIIVTWLLTFPVCGVLGYLLTLLFRWVF
jgi:PiT family inorganic phosphate transporter